MISTPTAAPALLRSSRSDPNLKPTLPTAMDAASNGDGPISIALGPMRQRTEVRSLEDDWTGVTSTADRRKLQNRLNQRAYRQCPLTHPYPTYR